MMHQGFPRPTSFRNMYSKKEWHDLEVQYGRTPMDSFLSLKGNYLYHFFANELKMTPSKDPPLKVFIDVLKQWITTQSLTKTMVNTLILENYYKC
jgi:hypothetical protein